MYLTKLIRSFALAFLAASISNSVLAQELNSLTEAEKTTGWKLLFDGKSTEGWRNFNKETVEPGWKIADGILTRAEKGAGDIITKEMYAAFELSIEYRISTGGNSGLIYHVTEEGKTPWQNGPEIQIQDNVAGKDQQKAGWLYQLYPADQDATKPAGEWK